MTNRRKMGLQWIVAASLGALGCTGEVTDGISSSALVGDPSPMTSTIEHAVIVGGGGYDSSGEFVLDREGSFRLLVRDADGNAVEGAVVTLDLSACDYVRICAISPGLSCSPEGGASLSTTTDTTGEAVFEIAGTIVDPDAGADGGPCAALDVDGEPFPAQVVAVMDLDGSGQVTASDLSRYLGDFYSGSYVPRSDYDGNGTLTAADMSQFLSHFYAGGTVACDDAGEYCEAPAPVGPRCGDSVCDGAESCDACPGDCGACVGNVVRINDCPGSNVASNTTYVLTQSIGGDGNCFTIEGQSHVTIEGAGHTIGARGIYMYPGDHVTVRNLALGSLTAYDSDYLTIEGSHLRTLKVQGLYSNCYGLTLRDNAVYQSADPADTYHYSTTFAGHTTYLVNKSTASSGGFVGDFLIEGNYFGSGQTLDHYDSSATSAITIRTTTDGVFRDNVVEGPPAYGLYLRDYIQHWRFEDNVFHTTRAALHVGSGSFPGTTRDNVFVGNRFVSDDDFAWAIQNLGAGNVFEDNVIASGSCGGYNLFSGAGAVFRHNTFVGLGSAPALCFDRWMSSSSATPDVFEHNVFSFLGTTPWALDHTEADFYGFFYEGDFNVFNSRDGQTPSNPRTIDDQSSVDEGGAIFVSLDPESPDFARPLPGGAACALGGTHAGAFPCQ